MRRGTRLQGAASIERPWGNCGEDKIMTTLTTKRVGALLLRGVAAAILPVALLAGLSSAGTTPASTTTATTVTNIAIPTPDIAGVPPLPGPVAAPATISSSIGVLTVSPLAGGPVGSNMTIAGSGLAANTNVELTWATQDATWNVDPEPNTVNYMGRTTTNVTVNLASTTTTASGSFSVTMKVPNDFGGSHEIYAVVNGVDVLEGAFTTTRTLTVTPKSGPIGTPITITYTGMGSSLFQNSAAILWDNHFAGELISEWTRGTGTTVIRAAGPVGKHVLMVGDALTDLYLNPVQSPYPFMNGGSVVFNVTKDNGPPTPSITWPQNVTPTLLEQTTLQPGDLDPASTAVATLSNQSGPVGAPVTLTVTGLSGTGTDQVKWATESGSRVDCSSVTGQGCWVPLQLHDQHRHRRERQLHDGPHRAPHPRRLAHDPRHERQQHRGPGALLREGEHRPLLQPDRQAPQHGRRHLGQLGCGLRRGGLRNGDLHLQGGPALHHQHQGGRLDPARQHPGRRLRQQYIGYGCGFNSNGYLVLHLIATGGPGTHLIDLHPMLYTSQPAFANTPYGLAPVLSSANDYPGLALGYQVPTFHFAIRIVK